MCLCVVHDGPQTEHACLAHEHPCVSDFEPSSVVSNVVLDEITEEVKKIVASGLPAPKLDVIIVGDRKDSATYVRMKEKACERVGILHETHRLRASISQEELAEFVRRLGQDSKVHGILLQLPLPDNLFADPIIELIPPEKDVDGLTTANAGILFRDGYKAPMIPVRCAASQVRLLRSHA